MQAMRLVPGLAVAIVTALFTLATPSPGLAAEPPNQNDPCSRAGRNTCGTNGIGFYRTYRYGIRWFGDFRGVVEGEPRGFCIDLRFWYPSPDHRYREDASATLVNKDGDVVSLANRRRMAYATWAFGRSTSANQQAAVMLYVHSLMGDAAPGEVDPGALGSAVTALYQRVAADAARYHGPYEVKVDLPDRLTLGAKGEGTIRILSATGAAVPRVALSLTTTGGTGVPKSVTTDASGVARIDVTATSPDGVDVTARTEPLASTLPRVFRPTTAAAARNGQRMVIPGSQVVTGSGVVSVTKSRLVVATQAVPASILVGETSRDRVTVSGATSSWKVAISARLHGPFRTAAAIRCDRTPAWTGTLRTNGSGTYTTPAVKLEKPGWYVYQHVVPGDAGHVGLTTPCDDEKERVEVEVQPKVTTVVSEQKVVPGTKVFDRVLVEGLAGEKVTVQASLYGPFASPAAIRCDTLPIWSGTLDVAVDGEVRTEDVTLTVPGYYTYRESIEAGELVRATETECGEVSETTVVTGTPKVTTEVSEQQVRPGGTVSDKVVVTGLGALAADVQVRLYGPFATRGAIRCTGAPAWKGTVSVKGDGTYTTAPARIDRVGFYVFRESITATEQHAAFTGRCGEASETTVARAAPTVTTVASHEVVLPGATVFDRVRVEGLGRSAAKVEVELFGPFASRDAIRCTGAAAWRTSFSAKGDGTYRTPATRLERVGLYAFRERLVGSDLITGTTGECGVVAETTLARPLVLTGKGDATARARAGLASPLTPARVRSERLEIDAPVAPAAIDLRLGALAVPSPISQTGWWLDGSTPGSRAGAVLIAGHVDSKTKGAGAFYRLREAKPGDRIQVTTTGGRTFTYRVVSKRIVPKKALPADIYSRRGRPRLVLVTCGGPFDAATGHYRDNVVVTAVRS
jgi:hypothetical protein